MRTSQQKFSKPIDLFEDEVEEQVIEPKTISDVPADFLPMPYSKEELMLFPEQEQVKGLLLIELRDTLWAMKEKRNEATYGQLATSFSNLMDKFIVLSGGVTSRVEVRALSEEKREQIIDILEMNTK